MGYVSFREGRWLRLWGNSVEGGFYKISIELGSGEVVIYQFSSPKGLQTTCCPWKLGIASFPFRMAQPGKYFDRKTSRELQENCCRFFAEAWYNLHYLRCLVLVSPPKYYQKTVQSDWKVDPTGC